jgi:NAD-dependent SIR2 family protein deacetylase
MQPILSFAASIYNDLGVYAALIGSGVSTEAGIKTGRDLTRELAELEARHLEGYVPADIEAWTGVWAFWLTSFSSSGIGA